MTESIDAYAQAQRALGLFVGVTTGLSEERQTIINAACAQLDRSLQVLLEAAETPAKEPEKTPRPIWHFAGVEGLFSVYPEPGDLVLTWSQETHTLQVLKCSNPANFPAVWKDANDRHFGGRVDYWMPIPPLDNSD